jgi:hypothetical protein
MPGEPAQHPEAERKARGARQFFRRSSRNVAWDPGQFFRRSFRRSFQNVARDPRHYQILTLAGLLVYGVYGLDLEVRPLQAAAMLATALATQLLAGRWLGGTAGVALGGTAGVALGGTLGGTAGGTLGGRAGGTVGGAVGGSGMPAFEPRSALISGLSLSLLLRTNYLALAVATAALTILSKFTLRRRGKHIFNPTNFGIVAMMLATGRVWVSPGQWGSAAFFTFLLLCLGSLVVNRAARSDVTYAFAGFYLAILFGRSLWLGQPLAIPLHQLESGAFLIFTFFMISDPKSTPDSRAGRILFALLVALGAGAVHFVLYRPNGLILALAACAPLTPLIDRLLPGRRYRWAATPSNTAGAAPSRLADPRDGLAQRRFA